jgi:hypothetical protein
MLQSNAVGEIVRHYPPGIVISVSLVALLLLLLPQVCRANRSRRRRGEIGRIDPFLEDRQAKHGDVPV